MYLYLRTGKKHANPKTILRLCDVLGFRLEPARLVNVQRKQGATP